MAGIIAYGTYVPYFRIQRQTIAAALGSGGGKGSRSVASYDEDTTSMGVEAGRAALARTLDGAGARAVYFATTRPAYLDKTNATAIHAALGLDGDAPAIDMVGAVRSGVGAVVAALAAQEPTLAVLSDVRTGHPSSAEEREGGDAAAALLCASEGDFIAEYLGGASATAEFLDRWRVPGEFASHVWEERFGEHAYVPLANDAIVDALKRVALAPDQIDHLVVAGPHPRSNARIARGLGVPDGVLVDDLASVVGNAGAAHPALLLGSVLDSAVAGQNIVVVVVADGCDVLAFKTTERLIQRRQPIPVHAQIAATRDDLSYTKFHAWRGVIRLEPPRRPDPAPPAAPPSFRNQGWKFAFTGSTCDSCSTRHLPAAHICMSCGSVDQMTPESFSDVRASVATFTIDRLAYSESPPVVVGVLDFDGGGRYQCELTDVYPDQVQVGDRVEMTFRRLFTGSNNVHNYFWKARPMRGDVK